MNPHGNVVEDFRQMSPDDFRDRIETLWASGKAVVDTIVEQVEQQNISPLQGLGIIGCTTSQLYAYQAFHGEASQADVASVLTSRLTPAR